MEYRLLHHTGEYRWILDLGMPFYDLNNNFTGYIGSCYDITDQKELVKQLEQSLDEKEILLKEIHHRVKNNLMIISSLLNLQSGYIKDKESQDIFKESQNRARSMALIHERLYKSSDLKKLDFSEYITSLATELFHTYVADPSLIKLQINVENIFLDINTAIPLGLIVNELITNSLKHAFPNGRKGEINVEFHEKGENCEFIVKDNGIGFPKDIDYKKTDSLGLQIVTNLTNQIDGKIELNMKNGTEFKINFKEVEL
jgi:two-component sensor histidine kinase